MHMLEHPDKRKSWGVKSQLRHYVGTSLEYDHYYWGYFKQTRALRGSETVTFKHKHITNPAVSMDDVIVLATKQLTDVLRGSILPAYAKSGIDQL